MKTEKSRRKQRKLEIFFLISVSIMLASLLATDARTIIAPFPVPSDLTNSIGSSQYYSVLFDGEGEATVAAKLQIKNTKSEDLRQIVIEIPGERVRLINAVQQHEKSTSFSTISAKTNVLSDTTQITLTLPKPIREQESSGVLLYYKVLGYSAKSLGNFKFKLQTIKTPYDTDYVRVAINVAEGLTLKAGESNVNYRQNQGFFSVYSKAMAESVAESSQLKGFSYDIMYQQGLVRTAQGLDPFENLVAEGEYGKYRVTLYLWRIMVFIAALTAVLMLMAKGVKKLVAVKKEYAKEYSKDYVENKPKNIQLVQKLEQKMPWPDILVVSFLSAFSLIMLWFGGVYVIKNLSSWLGYNNAELFAILFVAIMVFGIILAMFGGPIFIGLKHSARFGLMAFAATLCMLTVMSIIMLVFYVIFGLGTRVYY